MICTGVALQILAIPIFRNTTVLSLTVFIKQIDTQLSLENRIDDVDRFELQIDYSKNANQIFLRYG